jgi:superfamily II DNA helicase RecQ
MIDFCYTEHCYRAHILDYFGDRHHARKCGTCGNCAPNSGIRSPVTSAELLNDSPTSRRSRKTHIEMVDSTPRPLTVDETLRVRKILAGATRMKGRFGKTVLAASLRGSAAKNVMQSHLNELSTYGLLKDMRQDDILIFIDALIRARCLRVSPGEYPTVSITELGDRVMREQEAIELGLPEPGDQSHVTASVREENGPTETMMETYGFYQQGLPIEEIARQRNCTTVTIEGHLIDCLGAGFAVDIARFVSTAERLEIERAIANHGAERLKPLRDSLPETITYNMIRFVIAEQRQIEKSATDASQAHGQVNSSR